MGARGLRTRRRQLAAEFPDAAVSIAVVWGDSSELLPGVIMANSDGIAFYGQAPKVFSWSDVSDVRVIPHGRLNRESVHVFGRDGLLLRFAPMGASGIDEIGTERRAKLVAAINQARPRELREAG